MGFRNSRYDEISLEISVKKADLLVILKKNRDQHNTDYEKALHFWRKDFVRVANELEIQSYTEFPENLEDIRKNCPESCVSQYDDVIEMFEMGINDEILLTSDAYRKFCKDEWSWKSSTYGNYYYKNLHKLEEKKEI